jgi:O-antigen/teichoic acid export membrane protein
MAEESEAPRSAEEKERENRRLIELLNELRVALTGVQILFAFLLTVPFTQRFSSVTQFQKYVYFATLLCAAAAVACLIAPTAQHRMLFRRHQKHRLILLGNTLTIVGLAFLALAMTGVVMLITDVLFKTATVVVVTVLVAVVFAMLWYVMPLARRLAGDVDEPHS